MNDTLCVIYNDPITKLEREGVAKLIECVKSDHSGRLSIWLVEFTDESGELYQRTIDIKDIIE